MRGRVCIAILDAAGLVGTEMLKGLEERDVPCARVPVFRSHSESIQLAFDRFSANTADFRIIQRNGISFYHIYFTT